MKDLNESVGKHRITRGAYASDASTGNYGAFSIPLAPKHVAYVIAADGDLSGWEHVSVHVKYQDRNGKVRQRTPSWDEMCRIKSLFFHAHETVIQFHPAEEAYVNRHQNCLHLWRPYGENLPLPPTLLV